MSRYVNTLNLIVYIVHPTANSNTLCNNQQKTKLGSEHSIEETLEKIEVAAKDVSLYAERMSNSKVQST